MGTSIMPELFDILVVGGGNAAGYVTREYAALGKLPAPGRAARSMCILGREPYHSYERPALSKAFLAEGGPRLPGFHTCVGAGGERQNPEWYENNGIVFVTGAEVTKIDIVAKAVTATVGGEERLYSYNKLVFATGSRPTTLEDLHIPTGGYNNIHYLRTVDDALGLVAAMEKATADAAEASAFSSYAVVIGGGYIGTEVASQLVGRGLKVKMVVPEDYINFRVLTPEMAKFYEKVYTDKGVELLKGVSCTSVSASGVVTLNDTTTIQASLIVVGIGGRPNCDLLQGQVQMVQTSPGGVLTNGALTAMSLEDVPTDVYCIGDVAAWPLQKYAASSTYQGSFQRLEHVDNCRKQAAYVMQHCHEKTTDDYQYLPFFYSRVFNLSWQFYGERKGNAVHFGSHDPDSDGVVRFGCFFVDDGKVVGAFMENGGPDSANSFKRLASIARAQPAVPIGGAALTIDSFPDCP